MGKLAFSVLQHLGSFLPEVVSGILTWHIVHWSLVYDFFCLSAHLLKVEYQRAGG